MGYLLLMRGFGLIAVAGYCLHNSMENSKSQGLTLDNHL